MENTIENALEWYTEKWQRSVVLPSINNTQNMAILIHEYAKLIETPKDQRIAELEKQVEELGGQSILDTLLRNKGLREDLVLSADAIGLLQHDNARLEKENTDLRRALSECKARARIGVSPENR